MPARACSTPDRSSTRYCGWVSGARGALQALSGRRRRPQSAAQKCDGAQRPLAFFPTASAHASSARLLKALRARPNSASPPFRPVPRSARRGLPPDVRGPGPGLARSPSTSSNAKMVVLIGSPPGRECLHLADHGLRRGAGRWREADRRRPALLHGRGQGDWWLRSGRDQTSPVLLAWMNVLIARVSTTGLPRRARRGLPRAGGPREAFTPEWAEPITDLPAAQIRETRGPWASQPAVVVHPGRQ